MKLTYWSHSCFLIETRSHRLVVDPFLSGNPLAPVKATEVRCDFVLITHGHNDHVGDAVEIAKRCGATIVANYEVAMFCQSQGATVHPMHIGGSWTFPFGRVKLTIAHHGSAYQTADGFVNGGQPAGVLIMTEGKTVYHAGDTALFMDMQVIGQRHRPTVALLPIGDNFTMGIEDAVQAVEWLRPDVAVPMHYNTFDLIRADPQEFARQVRAKGYRAEVLAPGGTLTV
ncbi:MAG: metal-dependent hydrolase [Verrucomicrobiae bacterium]|nr:metal-dependent hydrolase [Verrucomicrobiae bacterium]MDW8343188.1 metal-dependent hydrolase [Verrucomicrobiae bacterium]